MCMSLRFRSFGGGSGLWTSGACAPALMHRRADTNPRHDTEEGLMSDTKYIAFLRGEEQVADSGEHPILELSDEQLRMIIGSDCGERVPKGSSTKTGSYNTTANGCSFACCCGTTVCCN